MALNRREFTRLLPFGALALALGGCATGANSRAGVGPSSRELFRVVRPGHAPKVLIFMPETTQTMEVWKSLSDELAGDMTLVAIRVDSSADTLIIARAIADHAPAAIVLMNNPTVGAYREYQRGQSAGTTFPPAVVVMTSFLGLQQRRFVNVTGIHYEVPLITLVTNLRQILASPVDCIGVVRRSHLSGFVDEQRKVAGREGISVVECEVGLRPNASELKRAIRIVRQRTDAIWVINDDKLLTPRLIADAWLPGVTERRWIPTIVGAASLVSPSQSFGTFAVLPDHAALGVQAAAMIFDLAEKDWKLDDGSRTRLPVSTTTTIDLVQARERFALREGALTHVDHILK